MAGALGQLPEGFVLDAVEPSTPIGALPEGFVADAPVEVSPPPEDLGFIDRVQGDLVSRRAVADEIKAAFERGEQTYAESILQLAGKVGAGGVLDVIGEGIVSGVQGLSAITPDIIETPLVEGVTEAGKAFLETDIGKAGLNAANAGLDAWGDFTIENPRAARNIEAIVDIGLLVAPVKGKPKLPAKPTIAGRAGESLSGKAVAQESAQKAAFVDDMVLPKQTAAVRAEQVGRTTEGGLLGSKKIGLSASERAMASEVGAIEGVSASKTLQGNFNAISQEVKTEAKNLTDLLKKNDVVIPKREFSKELDRAIIRLGENPLLVGDAAKTASKVVDKMKVIVGKNPGTASGLLKSRKELDAWLKTQKPKIFDPKQESALSIAVREVRQSTNDFIDARAVNVAVKDSLKKQSTLLRSMDNIAPKAAAEGGNVVSRLFQSVSDAIPIESTMARQIVAGLGIGGVPLVGAALPVVAQGAGVVAGTALGVKALASPAAKKGASQLLKITDKAIRRAKDETLISQLRIDRAALVELMKQGEE